MLGTSTFKLARGSLAQVGRPAMEGQPRSKRSDKMRCQGTSGHPTGLVMQVKQVKSIISMSLIAGEPASNSSSKAPTDQPPPFIALFRVHQALEALTAREAHPSSGFIALERPCFVG